ncbi:MAG: TonB-dependent receptor [bacterium]
MKRNIIICVILYLSFLKCSFAEDNATPVSVVKGKVVNFKTQQPVQGVTVHVLETKYGIYTKGDGSFKISDVPVGRYIIKFSAVGFESVQYPIVLTSGKEEQLNIQIQERFIQMDEVKVTAEKNSFAPINESAIVSSTVFTLDDVERYAGSRMDPARMAQNFAGVVGANDVRNDIIIRGGSPTELLWRLDGLDIPNPNHFATQGATGGPVNAINSNILDNSDFLIGAWPSEYGDKMSGVFDLRTRKGNDEKYEFLGQFGFNGFELGAEGPLPGNKSSFITNYRYSFLDLMEKMGLDFGFSGIPRYQDGVLKMDFQPNDKNQISLTGMLGISAIKIAPSGKDDVFQTDYAINNGTNFYILCLNWQYLFNERSYGKLTIGAVDNVYINDVDSVETDENEKVVKITPFFTSKSTEGYYSMKYSFHYAPDTRHFISAGIENRFRYYNLFGKELDPNEPDPYLLDKDGTSNHLLSYINWNWRLAENLTSNIGVMSQYLGINDKVTVEPRLALSWNFLPLHSVNIGFGVHRQSLPLIIYFSGDKNKKLDFMQALHYVAGYSFHVSDNAIIKFETYYKDISKAPVDGDTASYWSFLNTGTDFGVNAGTGSVNTSTGTGRTYGCDLSFIKNFSENYYVTGTTSYIRQQYKGSDGIMRFGAFDNIFVANLLSGYEWVINPTFTIEFSGKYTIAGGSPYIPIDLERSIAENDTKYDRRKAYSVRKPDYSRFDIRIDFRNNYKSFSMVSYISIENVLNNENVYNYTFNNEDKKVDEVLQLGFFFVGGIRIEF